MYDQAVEDFNKAIELGASNEETYYHRATGFYRKNMFMEALKDCEICIQINPKYSLAYMRIGQEYSLQLECVKNAIGNKDEALQYYNQAIQIDNKCILAYCNRGNLYKNQGNKDQALIDYNKAIELDTQYAFAYMSRGIFLDKIGKQEEELIYFNKAIELDPYDACIYNYPGLLFTKIGSIKQTLIDFNKTIELDPNFSNFYFDRGNLYEDIDNVQQALVDYDKAIELNPNDSKAYNNRGVKISIIKRPFIIQYRKHRHCTITNQLNQILMMLILIITEVIIGLLHLSLGNKDQAIIDHDIANQLDPKDAINYFNRGLCYRSMRKFDLALKDYTKAIELNSNDAKAQFKKGTLYKEYGQMFKCLIIFI
ncbi:unnamed protein product [Paramecium pentaurelia]|uniref:Tetratricopeptide repeat protein n=1 Tax=Paramecium pentaurelia TaxID=43138 RepID=A0A8S1YL18_9CILI|nr:unnamed protein product [Paramecium pentaurelia]